MKKETKTLIFLAIVIGLVFFLSFYPEIKEYFSSDQFMQFFTIGTEELSAPSSGGSSIGSIG